MMTEETVYEEQTQCRHVSQMSCFNAYKTVYKTTEVISKIYSGWDSSSEGVPMHFALRVVKSDI